MCAKLFTSITAIFLLVNIVSAQENLYAGVSNTIQSSLSSDYLSVPNSDLSVEIRVEKLDMEPEAVYYPVPLQISFFDSASGSILIAEGEINYTNAELFSKSESATVKKVVLKDTNRIIDISDVTKGNYYLILTSDSGKVTSEKIVIM